MEIGGHTTDDLSVTGSVQDTEFRTPVVLVLLAPYVLIATLLFALFDLLPAAVVFGILALLISPFVFLAREVYTRLPRSATLQLDEDALELQLPWATERVPLSGISGVAREERTLRRSTLLPSNETRMNDRGWSQTLLTVRVWGDAGSFTWSFAMMDPHAVDQLLRAVEARLN